MKKYTLTNSTISIDDTGFVFDDGNVEDVEITVEAWINLSYCFIPKKEWSYKRTIILKEWAKLKGTTILLWKKISADITTDIQGDGVTSTLSILWLASSGSDISACGVAKVDSPFRHISTRVDQTNILIGEGARVRWVPKLEIATDDIEWWHSCKMHRLGGDVLFYLESHGLSTSNAEALLLNAEILKHLSTIETEEEKREQCYEIHTLLKRVD